MTSLTYLDYGIFLVIGLSVLFAFFKGFIRSVLSLIALIIAITLTAFIFPITSDILSDFIKTVPVVNVASSLIPFLIILICLTIMNTKILAYLKDIHGGAIDRSLGVAFGLVRGCLIASILFFLINIIYGVLFTDNAEQPRNSIWAFNEDAQPDFMSKAESYRLLKLSTEFFISLIPQKVQDDIDQQVDTRPIKKNKDKSGRMQSDSEANIETIQKILTHLPNTALPFINLKQIKKTPETLLAEDHRNLLKMLLDSYRQHVKIGTIDTHTVTPTQLDALERLLPRQQRPLSSSSMLKKIPTDDGSYSEDQLKAIEDLISTNLD